MNLSERLRGKVRAELISAYPEALLNALAEHGIRTSRVERIDACTLRMDIYEKDWDTVRRLAEAIQGEAKSAERRGGSRDRKWLRRRAILLLSLLLVSMVLLWSELHIWKIEVHGCQKLTSGQVLRALDDCGVSTGSYWPDLSIDSARSRMLLRIPELAWMTVNVSGSCARVWVAERLEKPEIYLERDAADIVASRTGILRELTVLNGHPLVRRGSAVVKGETIVTGSLDSLTHPTHRVRAAARALADTWYEWTSVEPDERVTKTERESRMGCIALKFGKKRVNLLSKSRKELDGYDKIVHEYSVGLKGLFAFPVSLICEVYQCGETPVQAVSAGERLQNDLAERIEGDILQVRLDTAVRDGWRYTTLRAHCLENIAHTAETTPP